MKNLLDVNRVKRLKRWFARATALAVVLGPLAVAASCATTQGAGSETHFVKCTDVATWHRQSARASVRRSCVQQRRSPRGTPRPTRCRLRRTTPDSGPSVSNPDAERCSRAPTRVQSPARSPTDRRRRAGSRRSNAAARAAYESPRIASSPVDGSDGIPRCPSGKHADREGPSVSRSMQSVPLWGRADELHGFLSLHQRQPTHLSRCGKSAFTHFEDRVACADGYAASIAYQSRSTLCGSPEQHVRTRVSGRHVRLRRSLPIPHLARHEHRARRRRMGRHAEPRGA